MQKKYLRGLVRTPLHTVIIAISIIWMLPTIGLLITSLRPPSEVSQTGWWTIFQAPLTFTHLTLENYRIVFADQGIGKAFLNSLVISIPATILPVFLAGFAAYAFAKMVFPGRDYLFMVIVGLLVVPLQMTFIPILKVFNLLNLSGTFLGIWLAHTGYGLPLTIYLLHNYIIELPNDIFDSATIDGASTIQVFFKILIPLSLPAIASVVIFQFLWVWNDLLVALIFLGGAPDVAPLTLKVANMVGARGQNWEILTAAAFISMILPLCVFISMQKYFVRGILAGSIKG
jgi:alpha-glucoside transport system permease protein